MSISISVLIPNYNGRQLLEENLPSVKKALENYSFSFSEIIISDDSSQDESINYLQAHHPGIILCTSKENTGFSGAVNRGIAYCRGDLILILNSDVRLHPDYFQNIIALFEDPELFGVMGAIYNTDGSQLQDGAKYPVYQWGRIGSTLNYTSKSQSTYPTLFLSGANALVRRNYLLQLQGFSEIYNPYYCEDVDLGIRAWRAGWKCMFDARAICYHPNSETIKREKRERVLRISRRNKAVLHLIHLDGFALTWNKWMLRLKSAIWKLAGNLKYFYVLEDVQALENLIQSCRKQHKQEPYRYSFSEVIAVIRSTMPSIRQTF